MSLVVRVILIVSMLVQSIPGLAMPRCVAMPDSLALVAMGMPADAECDCCAKSEEGQAIECPMAERGFVGCNCKNSQAEDPKTPPSNQKSLQIERLLSVPVVPVILIAPPEPLPLAARWTAAEPSRRSGSHSIQSLLCVWRI
jgi:hypothetical protein